MQIGVKQWLFASNPKICRDGATNALTCPRTKVFFTASVLWCVAGPKRKLCLELPLTSRPAVSLSRGLIGPERQFGKASLYHPALYALLLGAVLPLLVWLWVKKVRSSSSVSSPFES